MSYYGFTVTDKGRNLIAKLLAGENMQITRVMFGAGRIPMEDNPRAVTGLYEPIAQGTGSKPIVNNGVASMTVEYRSDLNGGLNTGFWLREFGVYANDPDEGEILIYYATLGEYPQWVSPYLPDQNTGIDVRRFPISIAIGEDRGITVDYDTELWMTAEDVHNYFNTVLLPIVDSEIDKKIAEHNDDGKAHPPLQRIMDALSGRIKLLELQFNSNVTGNPFLVTFENLDDIVLDGTWNESLARVEF